MAADVHQAYVPRLLDTWPEGEVYQRVVGTMVFVDISGFTAMSERLAKRGRVGAEEVVSVLNTVFTELLAVATSYGGDLLKFGGDALLLLFRGENHTRRACRAAALMRHRLRSVGRLKTSAGNVHLKMSTGVNTGTFDLFLVGDHHLDLLPVGPAVSRVVALEGAASGGEIMISKSTAAELPAASLGRKTSAGFLLSATPQASEVTNNRTDEVDSEHFVPQALRSAVSASKEGEHRRVSIAFLHLDDTDGLVEDLGSEQAAAAFSEVIRLVQTVADKVGVTYMASDIDANALKIILCTGAPNATANDEERLLRAVREISDNTPAKMRIGVHRGPVFVGNVGAPFRRTYTIIGDAVNLAARVMAHAEPGQILATQDVLGFSDTLFEQAEVEPFHVKGKTEPVHAVALGGTTGTRPRTATMQYPLIGRDAELSVIRVAAAAAASGSGGAFEITGIAGIGKSRLVREATTTIDDITWRSWACERYEQATPFFIWRKILRTLVGAQRSDDPKVAGRKIKAAIAAKAPQLKEWAPLLGLVADADIGSTAKVDQLDAKFRTQRLHEVTMEFIVATVDGPTGLIIEEGQWMDPASTDLAAAITRQASEHPLLLAVVRSDEPSLSGAGATSIALEPLDEDSALKLARHATESSPLLNEHLERLARESGGNPMFLMALAANASSSDALPDSIEASVTAELDRLDPETRRVLRFASVIGSIFEPSLLVQVGNDVLDESDADNVWQKLGAFLERLPDGRFKFRQTITRDVAYETLPFSLRQRVHGQVGAALESAAGKDADNQAELLSLHFSRAHRFDKAWHYAVIAGDQALAKYANHEAARFYGYALEAGRHVEAVDAQHRARIAEARADSLELAGEYQESAASLQQARRDAGDDPIDDARLMRKIGLMRIREGKNVAAVRWFMRSLRRIEEATSTPAHLKAATLLAMAGVRFRQGRFLECVERCEEGLAAAIKGGDEKEQAHAYHLMSHARALATGAADIETSEKALAIFERLEDFVGQADVLNNRGVEQYWAGNWDAALKSWEHSRLARERAGDAMGAAVAENNVAEILSDQGKWDEAETMLKNVIRVSRAAGYWLEWVGVANLGRLETRRGELEAGSELLETALAQFELLGASSYVVETRIRLMQNRVMSGDADETAEAAHRLLRELGQDGPPSLMSAAERALGYACMQKADYEDARIAFERSLDHATAGDAGYELALTTRALSRLAQSTGADDQWKSMADSRLAALGVIETADIPITEPATR